MSLCQKCTKKCKQEIVQVMQCPNYTKEVKVKVVEAYNILEQRSLIAGKVVVRIPAQLRDKRK